jgi:two-component system response regulator FixJ
MAHQPTVFVVDDDSGVRRSLRALGRSHGLTVETYASAQAFLAAYDPDRPGCLLLDVRLAGRNGLDIQDELRRRGHELPIIVMTGHGDVPTSVRAFRGGALDFLEKPVPPRALVRRIREALEIDGESRRARVERESAARRFARLTPREREVASHLVEGKTSKEIAQALGISTRTAEGHRSRALEKMDVQSVVQLASQLRKLPVIEGQSAAAPLSTPRST